MTSPQLLTTEEAAGYLKRKPATLRAWRSRGLGPDYHKLVGGVMYDVCALEEFLKGSKHIITARPNAREDALVSTR